MMTFTPGPWEKDGLSVIAKQRGTICKCPVVTAGGVFNVEANARLIAAAPEMLRIMKEIHYVIEQEEMICPSCGILCCSDDCELAEIIALAQAGGESSAG